MDDPFEGDYCRVICNDRSLSPLSYIILTKLPYGEASASPELLTGVEMELIDITQRSQFYVRFA